MQPQIATVDGQPIMQLTPTSIPATLQLTPQTLSGQPFQDVLSSHQSHQQQLQFQPMLHQPEQIPQIISASNIGSFGSIGIDAATSTNDQDNDEDGYLKMNTNTYQHPQNNLQQNKFNHQNLSASTTSSTKIIQRSKMKFVKNQPNNSNQQQSQLNAQQATLQKPFAQQQQQPQQQPLQKSPPATQQHGGITVQRIVTKPNQTGSSVRLPVFNKQNITINRVTPSTSQQTNQNSVQVLPTLQSQNKQQQQSSQKKMVPTKTQLKTQPGRPVGNTTAAKTNATPVTLSTTITPASKTAVTVASSKSQNQVNATPTSKQSSQPAVPIPEPGPTGLDCSQCGRVFKKKEHLTQHAKLHTGHRPFKCNEVGCSKTFSRKEHLMRHIISHTGKKMFSCDLCHKLFSRKDNLNKHRR